MNLRFESPFENQPAAEEVTFRLGETPTVDMFGIDSVNPASLTVPPNTDFDVDVEFSSSGGFGEVFDPDHPDFCTVGLINRPGANLFVRLRSGGGVTTESAPNCWSVADDSPIFESLKAASLSSEGNQTLTAELVGTVSGEVHDSATVEINVQSGVSDPPEDPDDGEDDESEDVDDEKDPLDGILPDLGGDLNQGLVILVLLLLLLLIVGIALP